MANDFDTGIMILRGANVVKGSSIFEEQGFSYGVVESVVRAASNNHRWGGTNAADCIVRLNKYGLLTIHNLNTLQHLAEEAPEKLSQIADDLFREELCQADFNKMVDSNALMSRPAM